MWKMNIREATEYWVRGFNAIPQNFISEAFADRLYDSFVEVTPELFYCPDCGYEYTDEENAELINQSETESEDMLTCKHCNEKVEGLMDYREYSEEVAHRDYLPMWGTMWYFETSFDDEWVLDNIETMYKIGFRVYENEDLGVVIGIDGAGYDFYEAHWVPLYKARGLRWHSED